MDEQINFSENGLVDNYLICEDYKGDEGFFKFSKQNRYYFSFNANSKTYLRSQSYSSESARNNGIESIRRNSPLDERWIQTKTEEGKYYYFLKAGNQQEIARSCYYDSKEEMEEDLSWIRGENSSVGIGAREINGKWYPAAVLLKKEKPSTEYVRSMNEYLSCENYKGVPGFSKFEKNGVYYFAFNGVDGVTYLRSEGYTNEPSRDNGIDSVMRNAAIKERWREDYNEESKKFYYSLLAGNRQEIARSCDYDKQEDMHEALVHIRDGNILISKKPHIIKGEFIPKSNDSESTAVKKILLGSKELNDPVKAKEGSVIQPAVIEKKGGCGKWWILTLIIVALIILYLILFRNGNEKADISDFSKPVLENTNNLTSVNDQQYKNDNLVINKKVDEQNENEASSGIFEKMNKAISTGHSFVIEGLNFSNGKNKLTDDSKIKLKDIAAFLKKQREIKLEIQGHTDDVGNDEYNKILSEKRANIVKHQLMEYGIDASRLNIIGYGERFPIASNRTEEGKIKNRRIEFKIIQ